MATTTPNFSWPVPTSSDLVKNGATAIEGLGDAIDASLLDLKGGTTGQVLAKASATDMDFSWTTVAAGGGGKVLQVVSMTSTTAATSASTTLVASPLTLAITPTLSTSKILILTSQIYFKSSASAANAIKTSLYRGGSSIALMTHNLGVTDTTQYMTTYLSYHYLDSPATTSSTTYTVYFANTTASGTVGPSANSEVQTMILMEIGA